METDVDVSVEDLVENEWYIVRYSGETPEIAYNASMYYLQRATDGPGLVLNTNQVERLQQAAKDRYEDIVLRDMYHDNVGKTIYRGIARSICNYERLLNFCARQNLSPYMVREKAATLYSTFLQLEYLRITSGNEQSVLNCSYSELRDFANALGVHFPPEYELFQCHCAEAIL